MRVLASLLLLKTFLVLVAAASDFECGQRKVDTVFLVHHGREAKEGHWPWHAAILHRYQSTFSYTCGGSIIDRNTILTAAHCLITPNGFIAVDRLSVQVGRTRLYVGDGRSRSYEPDRFIIHPQFEHDEVHDDIALIKLATDIEFTDFIQPVCLWNRGVGESEFVGQVGSVVGFGLSETDEVSDYLREAQIPVVSFATCVESNRETFGQKLTKQMYCAGSRDGVSACNGDSGGGMFFELDNAWYVRGLVSFTPSRKGVAKCDPYEYTVYTDVAKYLDWIRQGHNQAQSTLVSPIGSLAKSNPKLSLLNLDICGFNSYPFRKESTKPVFLNYPWIAMVEYANGRARETRTLCHAVLISEWYLLTTAHCVAGPSDKHKLLGVRLGDYDLSTTTDCVELEGQRRCAPPLQIVAVDKIIVHEQYNTPNYANDIALLKLRDRAKITQDNIKPVCLPVTKKLRETQPNVYVLTGWSKGSPLLRRSAPTHQNRDKCRQQYLEQKITVALDGGQICAFQKSEVGAPCNFSASAAPLQVVQNIEGSDRYVLQGLLSFGSSRCTSDLPEVYTNVNAYVDWIMGKIESQEEPSFVERLVFT
ncbi:transmembrane protease serine 9-like isoform X2 [Anopheles aquasalis]|nr:transmembrane protease serine 9-like isoform X2 [Anopheles aquasalis]XP_050087132.1 transmembrane protease serine 9-like isoform X2 [Anopheles aquasalis]XP_050087133.1 transmembrane protease serine 9-like isoform X2 [Anopheles aquasalis]